MPCRKATRPRPLRLSAYDSYFSGKLEDFAYPDEAIKAALERLPTVG